MHVTCGTACNVRDRRHSVRLPRRLSGRLRDMRDGRAQPIRARQTRPRRRRRAGAAARGPRSARDERYGTREATATILLNIVFDYITPPIGFRIFHRAPGAAARGPRSAFRARARRPEKAARSGRRPGAKGETNR